MQYFVTKLRKTENAIHFKSKMKFVGENFNFYVEKL